MVNGIPVILCYKMGNLTYIPDDTITGADAVQLDLFFKDEVEILNVAAGIRTKTTYMEVGLNYPSLVAKE
jgi:hypothetical protein